MELFEKLLDGNICFFQMYSWVLLKVLYNDLDIFFFVSGVGFYSLVDVFFGSLENGIGLEDYVFLDFGFWYSVEVSFLGYGSFLSSLLFFVLVLEFMIISELCQVIVVMMNRKDELEEENRLLWNLFDGEMEYLVVLW